jgi:hypothetical protein
LKPSLRDRMLFRNARISGQIEPVLGLFTAQQEEPHLFNQEFGFYYGDKLEICTIKISNLAPLIATEGLQLPDAERNVSKEKEQFIDAYTRVWSKMQRLRGEAIFASQPSTPKI